jgi:bidirectional [NiFe] hydrogenase diaphorase subunit
VPLSQAYGVVTFYHHFSLKPPGKHTMTICTGTACYIKGTDKLVAAAEKRLGIPRADHQGRQHQPDDGPLRGRLRPRSGGAHRRRTGGQMSGEQMLEQLERWAVE